MTERLLDNNAPPPSATLQFGVTDPLDRRLVVAGLRGQIEENVVLRVSRDCWTSFEPGRELRVGVRIVQIAREVKEILGEVGPEAFIERRVLKELVETLPSSFRGRRRRSYLFASCR